ncbi:TPA: glucose 1-dehydrogenase [Stenotrophomonas maltophilia]|uniref:SDR family NAD(P)-dependent oxidoreductase n=1 Tax=Stenotrophomonas TaxID=40323 RepID=UPI000D161658|nr:MULTISPECIES: glucose 1-dehydrogenase [unclassified Stenotrophomonas]PTA72739.1 oxidoreductase [Stenotrophomonas sp. Nf1]PTA82436.1 oxidoreductase [Stenotrophomonas sp. Nf4]
MSHSTERSSGVLLPGRVVIVTGGGTGIGRGAALAYARHGAKVVLAGRRSAEIEGVAHEISAAGGEAISVSCDVSIEEDVRHLIDLARAHYGRLDAAFNNAGILGTVAAIHEQTSRDFDATIGVNLRGVWLCMKYEVQAFVAQERGGAIVNTSSWLAKGSLPGMSAYSASKGALDAMIRAVAIEQGPNNIRINNVSPGIINTSINGRSSDVEKIFEPFIQQTPLKRVGQPEDVGDVVAWLCSDEARFITGQSIVVDGGFSIPGRR